MPVITKLVVSPVVRFGAKQLIPQAVAKTKIRIKSEALRTSRGRLISLARRIAEMRQRLQEIANLLGDNWGGEDYQIHAAEHLRLCEAVLQMQECIDSCGAYLGEAADTFDGAQSNAKRLATGISSARN